MSLIIRQQEDQNRERQLIPTGPTVARCYRIIDLGTQETTWQGQVSYKAKVMLMWELPKRLMDDGRPFSIHKEYTLSLSDKANLRKDIEQWMGTALKDEDTYSFDITWLLGNTALINVGHKENENSGKTYANITSLMPVPDGMDVPPAVNEPFVFNLDQYSPEVFNKLPQWVQDKIKKCNEWPAIENGTYVGPNLETPDQQQGLLNPVETPF